jgi:hypothetical protein
LFLKAANVILYGLNIPLLRALLQQLAGKVRPIIVIIWHG